MFAVGFSLIEELLDNHTITPFSVELPVSAIGADFVKSHSCHQRQARGVFWEHARNELPKSSRLRRLNESCHRDAPHTSAAMLAGDVYREFGNPGVAVAAAVWRSGSESNHSATVIQDHHIQVTAVEPARDLLSHSRFSLEGRDAIGDALVVNAGNRLRIATIRRHVT